MADPNLVVYHMKGSRSLRVTWLLEELGLPYSAELIGFDLGNAGGADYRKVHPLNKVPALVDGETTMFESVAIMQYIMNKYGDGGLRPEINDADYGTYLQWLHYGEATLAPIVVTLMQQRNFFPKEQQSEFVDQHAEAELIKHLGFLEAQLSEHDYILERGFSAADISIGYCLLLIRFAKAKNLLSERLLDYWKVLTERDAWVDASH
jgi:glutathione S-transferase